MRRKWAWRLLAGVALSGLVMGCAEEREPINRVQPMALQKSFFLGANLADPADDPEFYTQQFITDVPYGVGDGYLWTVGFGGKVGRVKFEITENYLIARINYERIEGTDGHGADPNKRDGVIAAMFPIISHFDIRRSYNPQTGEEMNIVEENQSDRPWYEREYIRVDWSKNLNTDSYDFDVLSDLGLFGGTTYEPLTYDVTDPKHPDAPHFSVEDGYFDITTKAFAAPGVVDLSHLGWGIDKIPSCMLEADFFNGTAPGGNCNPTEITIRLAFRKVVDTDYEPAHWDGYKFQAFGAFYIDRRGYNPSYGIVDEKWMRLINRYNIWERSHYYDDPQNMTGAIACATKETTPGWAEIRGPNALEIANRDDDGNGTADECEAVTQLTGVAGSRCDIFKHKCTLPYRARVAKPVAWYFTNTDPEINNVYFEPTELAAHEWDVALRTAVNSARYVECMATKGADCAAKYPMYRGQQQDNEDTAALAHEMDVCRKRAGYSPDAEASCAQKIDQLAEQRKYPDPAIAAIAKQPEMLVLCHSPVADDDPPLCGERGMVVRMGDLRYHQVNTIPQVQSPSPWGIMVNSTDPVTGEVIMGSTNCFSFVNDVWSQGVVDYARYIKGELSTEDITEAKNVRAWVQAEMVAKTGGSGGIVPRFSRDQIDQMIASVANVDVEMVKDIRANPAKYKTLIDKAREFDTRIRQLDIRASADVTSTQRAIVEARRNQAKGTEFEAKLVSPALIERAGLKGMPVTGELMNYVSPLRMNNPQFELEWRRMKETALAKRGMCILDQAPEGTGMTTVADILYRKFPPAEGETAQQTYDRVEAMRNYLRKRAHYAVILHEMGHGVGHRHNFVSSYDSMSFRPQYWQLRTKNGQVERACTELDSDGEDCIGPRYFDPVTPAEQNQLITMFQQDSVMDYAGAAEGDLIGLGAWDYAATRMFYGETVAVYADPDMKAGTSLGLGVLSKMDNFGGITGIQYGKGNGFNFTEFHYSELQKHFKLIKDCYEVKPEDYIPSDWDYASYGPWDPILDGRLVMVDGKFTKCRERPVDYVSWHQLRQPKTSELSTQFYYRGGPSVDPQKRLRVPYGFATDSWADLGNLAVYRHDIGADPYELFQFFITQQETRHIWDNYRRGRTTFSVRNASNRTFERFNAKMRDGAKGLGLYANLFHNFAVGNDLEYNSLFAVYMTAFGFEGNLLASGMAFDHFARTLARPHSGPHFFDKLLGVWVAEDDSTAWALENSRVTVPNGATGFFYDVGIAGRPVNNALAENTGEYDRDYTLNAGSYYDKINAPILFAESVDNFISSSRNDFVDPRYRSVSVADLFPEGYRRMVANLLTGDEHLKGPRLWANEHGAPLLDSDDYPQRPLGWTSWWPANGPEVCFPNRGSMVCSDMLGGSGYNPEAPKGTSPLDAEVGWEQQKHLIAQTLLYLPENQKQRWLEQMTIWEIGRDADPTFTNRVQFQNPITGKTYVARTYGKETVMGVPGLERGIAGRMLQYANSLVEKAFKLETDPAKVAPDNDGDGKPDWPTVVYHPDGTPVIIATAKLNGNPDGATRPQCDQNINPTCAKIACEDNAACMRLQDYIEVIFFMRQAIEAYGLDDLSKKGVYD